MGLVSEQNGQDDDRNWDGTGELGFAHQPHPQTCQLRLSLFHPSEQIIQATGLAASVVEEARGCPGSSHQLLAQISHFFAHVFYCAGRD